MKGIKAKIVDFNNLEFENEINIDVENEIMNPINSYIVETLEKSGILILLSCAEIFDSNKLQIFILNKIYPNYKIENHEGDKYGVPDFKLINKDNDKDYFWVEVKTNQDGLRFIQLDWIVDAIKKGEKVKLLIIKSSFSYNDYILSWCGNNFVSLDDFKNHIKQHKKYHDDFNERKKFNDENLRGLDNKYF
jgi:hypothetical protein